MKKVIKMFVACRNANGSADLVVVRVRANEDEVALGMHYDMAEAQACDKGYEKPFVCFDPHEQTAILAAALEL